MSVASFERAAVFVALLALNSSGALAQAPAATGGTETVNALYMAFERGDVPAIKALLSPDVTWTFYGPADQIPYAGTWRGPDGVMQWFGIVDSVIKVEAMDLQAVTAAGPDRVYSRGVERTFVRATGGRYAAEWVHAFTVRDGRIESFEEFMNTAAVVDGMAPADSERGRAYFTTCVGCHGAGASGNRHMNAPNLSGQDPEYLLRQLRNFQAEVRGGANSFYGWMMNGRAKALPGDRALRDVVSYIGTLRDTRPARTRRVGDVTRGQRIFTTCAQCHGVNGEGNRAVGAPRLNHLDDWYVARQLSAFVEGQRGTHAADEFGQRMRAGAMPALRDGRAIDDVAAYIASLP